MLLTAYQRGVFPMAVDKRGRIGWFSPDPRAVIPLDARFHIPHGLRRVLKQKKFEVTSDTDFTTVIRECAKRKEGTWISPGIIDSYCNLHRLGYAHSVETRLDGKLVGGLYGVALGGAFSGKACFIARRTRRRSRSWRSSTGSARRGFVLLDTQWTTPHLQQFGTREIPRHEYLWQLEHALKLECRF